MVAVSGGPDSMALLHVLALLRGKHDFRFVAHGVDHGLRPEAEGELDGAEAFARALDVPFDRSRVSVVAGGNLQARARTLRYEALEAHVARVGASWLATAHHADDRAETVLLRLLRGAGPRGLAVLPERSGLRIRPMLAARRAAIDSHNTRHAVPFFLDPSNDNPRFLRVRVRRELLPLLAQLDAGVVEHLNALADDLAGCSDARGESMSRRGREAIEALERSQSCTARVRLSRALVARYDRTQAKVIIEPG
ncbi:MAG: tRNA lysidine(34) synthetase TilS [Myxococcales bacterium]